ncbi:MAG: hypothetical protein ACR2NM_07490 [Bythopirellula sp.]
MRKGSAAESPFYLSDRFPSQISHVDTVGDGHKAGSNSVLAIFAMGAKGKHLRPRCMRRPQDPTAQTERRQQH